MPSYYASILALSYVCFLKVYLYIVFIVEDLSLDFPVIDLSESNEKSLTRAQKKNMRKRQKKKESKLNDYAFEIEEVIGAIEDVHISEDDSSVNVVLPESGTEVQDELSTDASKKKIRTLKKKLKQIEELEEKLCLGELKPNKEQIIKLSKKEEIVEEIKALSATI